VHGALMNRIRAFGIAGAVALAVAPVAATISPSVALASYPGTTGRIVFDGGLPDNTSGAPVNAIFSVNPDGSDLQKLTTGTTDDLGPDVSADGSKIVYSRGPDNDSSELWVMNSDGSGQHQLTHDGSRDWYPSWSPDGSTIAFRSDQTGNGDIYTIPAAGGNETRLTTAAGLDSVPEYSPDGSKILFHSMRENSDPVGCDPCAEGVYVMNADGSGQTKLIGSPGEQDRFPSWSPDGLRIVFNRMHVPTGDDTDGIYTAAADGTDVERVPGPPSLAQEADFSPDGQLIAYEVNTGELQTIPVAGGTPRPIVTDDEARPESIDWGTIPGTHPTAQAPTVLSVSPNEGLPAGGTTVTVNGTGLLGTSAVHFGTAAATAVQVVSDAQLTATAPAGTGQVDVTVTTGAGTSATGARDTFNYQSAPTVTGIAPASGAPGGGTSVVITGMGLSRATGVLFGGTSAASYSLDNDGQITAVSPAGSGTVDVTVTSDVGSSATSAADHFTFANPAPAPRITSTSPNAGPRAGGTTVTLGGSGFSGATRVTVGGAVASFSVVSDTRLTLRTPASSTVGTKQVRVTTAAGTSATVAASTFTYGNPPTVTRVSPATGTARGGTVVTLTGSNFTGATAVRFGIVAGRSVHVVSATKITVTSPAGRVGVVDVRVSTRFGTSSTGSADRFTYRR
jgi:Tol biopolymer transport system component